MDLELDNFYFLDFLDLYSPFWGQEGFENDPELALSSLNISPYRAIWTRFRSIFMIFIDLILQTGKAVGTWDMSTIHSPRIHDRSTIDLGEIHHN